MVRKKNYPAEYKMEMVANFNSSGKTITAFCKENDLCKSTFFTWLSIYRGAKTKPNLIDVVSDVKAINVNALNNTTNNKFAMKIDNITFEFNINDFIEVFKVIKNG